MNKIKKILALIAPYKGKAILNVVFNILSVIFSLFSVMTAIPFLEILFDHTKAVEEVGELTFSTSSLKEHFYYYLSNIIETEGGETALIYLGLIILLMTFFKTAFRYLSLYYLTPIQNGVVRDIRFSLYKKILALPLSYYSEEKKGDLISRMTNDLLEIRQSVVNSIEVIFVSPLSIIIYLAALTMMSFELTTFVFIFLPISGYIIGKVGKNIRRESSAAQNKMGELLSMLEETIGGLRVIKAFNAESKMNERFGKENNLHFSIWNSIQRRFYLAHPVSEMLGTIVIITIMWYGATLIINDKSDISTAFFASSILFSTLSISLILSVEANPFLML